MVDLRVSLWDTVAPPLHSACRFVVFCATGMSSLVRICDFRLRGEPTGSDDLHVARRRSAHQCSEVCPTGESGTPAGTSGHEGHPAGVVWRAIARTRLACPTQRPCSGAGHCRSSISTLRQVSAASIAFEIRIRERAGGGSPRSQPTSVQVDTTAPT